MQIYSSELVLGLLVLVFELASVRYLSLLDAIYLIEARDARN